MEVMLSIIVPVLNEASISLASEPAEIGRAESVALRLACGAAAQGSRCSADVSLAEGEEQQALYPLNPSAVIAAAFKAAGLPVPEIPPATRGATPRVAPGPIIAAALKAAGLLKS